MSNERNPGWLDYIGDYTTQLYRDYSKPLKGSLLTNQDSMESTKGFFSWFTWTLCFFKKDGSGKSCNLPSQVSQQFEEALVSAGVPVEDLGFLEKKQNGKENMDFFFGGGGADTLQK